MKVKIQRGGRRPSLLWIDPCKQNAKNVIYEYQVAFLTLLSARISNLENALSLSCTTDRTCTYCPSSDSDTTSSTLMLSNQHHTLPNPSKPSTRRTSQVECTMYHSSSFPLHNENTWKSAMPQPYHDRHENWPRLHYERWATQYLDFDNYDPHQNPLSGEENHTPKEKSKCLPIS